MRNSAAAKANVVAAIMGYSQAELDDVQAKWGFHFPPDLMEQLRERRLLVHGPDCFDWIKADAEHIRERLAWPFESYWRTVERLEVWWPEWGERPTSLADQKEKLRCIFGDAPKLIPLVRLRYIPDEPHESGNPVFSVMASDIIHYGANLIHWLERERAAWRARQDHGHRSRRSAFGGRLSDMGKRALLSADKSRHRSLGASAIEYTP